MTQVRSEKPRDVRGISWVHRAAFGQEDEAELVQGLRRTPAYLPALSLVGTARGRVVGHALFTPVARQASNDLRPVLILAPVGVLPRYQRKGYGSALIRAGLSRARECGFGLAVVVGDPEYYCRFGFIPARSWGLELPFPVPDPVFMVRELQPGALGTRRGLLVLPAPFFDLEW